MKILKIGIEEQLLIKHYMIKPLILLKMRYMMDVDVDLLKWPLIKKLQVEQLKIEMFLMKN